MVVYYHLEIPDDMGTFSTPRLESIRDFLRTRLDCPVGSYDVFEGQWIFSLIEGTARRWGVAVKSRDGTVTLIPDQPG